MFIKLCGFTRNEDIEMIKSLPVSAAGFIFYKNSRRYVSPRRAGEMALMLKGSGIKAVGVFVDDEPETVMEIVKTSHLDMIQVYNSNTANILSPRIQVIRCLRIGSPEQQALPEPDAGGMVLFDTYSEKIHGGTGKSFNHELVRNYPYRDRMIIAGGLNEGNICNIIRELNPGGIDLSSGIEVSEGIKSEDKILKIIELIKEAENDIHA